VFAWQRNTRGTPTRGRSRHSFVHYLENHDQVANLAFGERLAELIDPALYRALATVLLLSPEIPMLFQGQETGSTTPWHYFVDLGPELDQLVRRGRAQFVGQLARLATPEAQARLADPGAPATFAACRLPPSERSFDRAIVKFHRDLLRLRSDDPAFLDGELAGAVLSDRAFCIRWWHSAGDRLLLVNLGTTYKSAVLPEPLLAPPRDSGWRTLWSSEHPEYGGHGTPPLFTLVRLAIPAHAAVLCTPDPAASLRVRPRPPTGQEVPVEP
jgi:maltooligosyltrehalose trehalohydrolase